MLTAYDAVTARILDAAGTDMLLVGDSIGNVMLGHESTLPVELDEMVVATRSVARATTRALVVADLPFGTYEAGPAQALASAVRLMKAGANAVKLEGGRPRAHTVRALGEAGIPVVGTMAHAFVQSFDSEYEAFLQYAKTWPDNTVLLVDTYDTLRQGIPNAIRVHNEYLAPNGHALRGIRIDSGDLAYLSNRAREMLDAAGMHDTIISVSNALDEYLIKDLMQQRAAIDAFGVGERLITAKSDPVFGGVYKIVALEKAGSIIPKIKISETLSKTTTPGFKQLWRLYDNASGKAIADLITLHDEIIDDSQPYELFDPEYPWKRKTVTNYRAEKLMRQWMEHGARSAHNPSLDEIRAHCAAEQQTLWDEIRRLENPHGYYVDLSVALWQLKQDLIREHAGKPQ